MDDENYNSINETIDKKISEFIGKKNIIKQNSNKTNIKNLVLSGGGPKGIALLGALQILEENDMLKNIKTIAGASIGGVISCLMCIGYSPMELFSFINLFDTSKFNKFDPSFIFDKFGLDNGETFEMIIGKLFECKNISKDITFKEMYEYSKIKVILTTVCVNDKQTYYISHINYPNMKVITGIRMTTAIPLIFAPVNYNGRLYVDGACNDNYPIHLFKDELFATIGLCLRSENKYVEKIDNIETFLYCLIKSLGEGVTCNSINGFENETILINCPNVEITQFTIEKELKKELFECGKKSCDDFIKSKMRV